MPISDFTVQDNLKYYSPSRLEDNPCTDKDDIWALGVLLLDLMSHNTLSPFNIDYKSYISVIRQLETATYTEYPQNWSQDCRNLIKWLLVKDPAKRPSIFDVLSLPLVKRKIVLMTEDCILGDEISLYVTNLLLNK